MLLRVPNGEGKHSTKFRKAWLAPSGIGLEENFGVRVADKNCASPFQLRTNFKKVVDLAVVDNPVAAFRIVHGLMAERREIENRKTPASESNFNRAGNRVAQQDGPRIVRPTMRKRVGTALQNSLGDMCITPDDAKDSTHSECSTLVTLSQHNQGRHFALARIWDRVRRR